MATHDYVIDNSTGANVRADINNVLQAVLTNNSNSSSPSTTAAYMLWVDTTANIIKIRNSANNAWINLFTTAGGVDVDAASTFSEDVTFTGASANIIFDKSADDLIFNDNAKAAFGTSSDLTIFHDGSNSRIADTGTGFLVLQTSKLQVNNAASNEEMLTATENGAVELFYDNSKKFETKSDGVLVTGELQATTLDINGNGHIDGTLQLTNDLFLGDNDKINIGSSNDLKIYHGGSTTSTIEVADGHSLILRGADNTSGTPSIQLNPRGNHVGLAVTAHQGVSARYDNAIKLETSSVGITVSGTTITNGEVRPANDNNHSIGLSNRRYTTIFAVNGSINTSDRTEKNTIVESDLGLNFIEKLKPVSFKWNKDDGKTHYGLIAQDIEETILSLGKTVADFGCISKEKDSPMGLSYPQLLSPLIKAVQQLSAKVAALEVAQ